MERNPSVGKLNEWIRRNLVAVLCFAVLAGISAITYAQMDEALEDFKIDESGGLDDDFDSPAPKKKSAAKKDKLKKEKRKTYKMVLSQKKGVCYPLGRRSPWSGTIEQEFGLDMYRYITGPKKKYGRTPRPVAAYMKFDKYWKDGTHPSQDTMVEVNYRDFMKTAINVYLYSGSGYHFLGQITDKNDKKWHTAFFLAKKEWIGADDKGKVHLKFTVPTGTRIGISTVRFSEVTNAAKSVAMDHAIKFQRRLRKLSGLGFTKQNWGGTQKCRVSPDEVDKTYLIPYQRMYIDWQYPLYAPTQREVAREISVTLAKNEIEPLTLSLYALNNRQGLKLTLGDFTNKSGKKFPGSITPQYVEHALIHHRKRDERTGTIIKMGCMAPWRILPITPGFTTFSIDKNRTLRLWCKVSAPANTPAGTYSGAITIHTNDKQKLKIKAHIKVLPFQLDTSIVKHGVVTSHVPSQSDIDFMSEMQMTGIQLECSIGDLGLGIFIKDDKLDYQFEKIDKKMKSFIEKGLTGPVIVSIAHNASELSHREWRHERRRLNLGQWASNISSATHRLIGQGQIVSLRYFKRFGKEFLPLNEHSKTADWPEMAFSVTGSVSDVSAPLVYDILWGMHQAAPDTKVFVPFINRWQSSGYFRKGRYGRYLGKYVKWWGTKAFDFPAKYGLDKKNIEKVRKMGKNFLITDTGNAKVRTGYSRFANGFYAWAMGADAVLISAYKRFSGTAFSDTDGGWDNSIVVGGLEGDYVPIPACIGAREGIDDLRYLTLLQKVAKNSSIQNDAQKLLDSIRKQIVAKCPKLNGIRGNEARFEGWADRSRFHETEKWRKQIQDLILKAKK